MNDKEQIKVLRLALLGLLSNPQPDRADPSYTPGLDRQNHAWATKKAEKAIAATVPAQSEASEGRGARPDSNLVPGKVRCAKCGFSLIRNNLNLKAGTITAGDNKTEPCPNGCGPLWQMTWEQEAHEVYAVCDGLFKRAIAAENALTALQSTKGKSDEQG